MITLKYRIQSTLEQLKLRCEIYVYPISHSILGVYSGIIIRVSHKISIEDVLDLLAPLSFCQISVVQDLRWWECFFKKKHLNILHNPKIKIPTTPQIDHFDEELKILERLKKN